MKRGQLSLAALSDYIRVSLLYRYGGLWVDSTILCVGKLPEDVFNKELFTIKNKPAGQKFVAGGKWNVQFLGTNQIHSKVFFLMKSIFDQYWEKYSVIIDYLLVDYSFQYIYDTHPDCRAAFDAVPMTNAHMHELLPVMNSAFSADEWQRLQSDDTFLFKLTYKWQYEETCRGKDTFYSYVIKQFG